MISSLAFLISLKNINKEKEYKELKSVNYHFTRICNYNCGFCFHTSKTSYMLPIEEAKRGLEILKKHGMKKLNFSGGEPFLYPKFVGELSKYCKEELNLESVSVVSNGSKLNKKFIMEYGKYIDIIAISCDSFDENINTKIGRGNGTHINKLKIISKWCNEYNIKFKINTVVNIYNYKENMIKQIEELKPIRWKCFQVLKVQDENIGKESLRNVNEFIISDEQFNEFCIKHENLKCFVKESKNVMQNSYIILDEYMRFLDKSENINNHTDSILNDKFENIMKNVNFDDKSFIERGGIYDWSKNSKNNKYDW